MNPKIMTLLALLFYFIIVAINCLCLEYHLYGIVIGHTVSFFLSFLAYTVAIVALFRPFDEK
jgi:hypothetical protein